ncbi:unnamed protein product [Mytilus edulis]|uniref:DUF6570 domain-containing protein n=1 Tax=Mytilus edulis TaxID=6550 RepID=A0A8S3PWG1_MYTED|nr:unnamed protein product [Mytilus edulis]
MTDGEFRARKIDTGKRKYWENEEIRSKKIYSGIKKYEENEIYRDNMIHAGIQKYQEDENYRDTLIDYGIHKYQEDEDYRKALIQSGIEKYKDDNEYREKLKQASIHKYEADKYANDDAHRIKIKQQTSVRRESLQEENKQISEVIRKFKDEVKKGPECVCACCLRLFFEKQVQICKKDSYDNSIFDSVTTNKYEHKCTDDCKTNCAFEGTCRTSLWICYTCHRKMLKGKIPADSFSNSLLLEDVPVELKRLNSIEQQLIAQNIPFMKIMALPKGGQKGVHGPVVCVPSDLKKVTSILPRSEDESLLLKVKLKRKLNYKGYDKYQFVRPNHLEQALLYLKDQNIWYKDVTINNEWINPIPELDDNQVVNE